MRRAAVAIFLAAFLAAAPARAARVERAGEAAPADGFVAIPPLAGPVVDTTGTLAPETTRRIEALAHELEQKTGAEMAVLLVRTTQPEDAFDYGMRVAEAWKLGKRPRAGGPNFGGGDNGLLFLVALDDRKMRMLTGYGLEGVLPDGRVGEILDRFVVPAFRQGDVDAGVYQGLRAAAQVVADAAGVQLTGQPPLRAPPTPALQPLVLFAIVLVVLIALWVVSSRQASRGGRRRRYGPVFWGGGYGGWDGGSRGGGFGGGGLGGGGGGFGGGFGGGGSFGGGGAGRGW